MVIQHGALGSELGRDPRPPIEVFCVAKRAVVPKTKPVPRRSDGPYHRLQLGNFVVVMGVEEQECMVLTFRF